MYILKTITFHLVKDADTLNWAPMKSKHRLVKLGLGYLSLVSSMLVCIDQDFPGACRILFTFLLFQAIPKVILRTITKEQF